MFKFRIDHPYRPVNWRWERARIVNEYGALAPGRMKDDKWVKVITSFRAALDRCKNELDIYRVFERWPSLATAYELWDNDNFTQGRACPMRYEIESRILAGETLATISKKSGVPVPALEFYEKTFFNVLDRLSNKMYILHIAVGDQLQRGMTDRDYSVLWKLYGYVRGPEMLDYLITTFSDWTKPSIGQAENMLLEDHRSNMKRKAALASRMTGINQHTADRLIELHTKITEVEKSSGDGSPDAIHQNIQVMLSHLPLMVGAKQDVIDGDPIKNYSRLTADLRANELLALSTGQPTVDPATLAEFKFPEPQNNDNETPTK